MNHFAVTVRILASVDDNPWHIVGWLLVIFWPFYISKCIIYSLLHNHEFIEYAMNIITKPPFMHIRSSSVETPVLPVIYHIYIIMYNN